MISRRLGAAALAALLCLTTLPVLADDVGEDDEAPAAAPAKPPRAKGKWPWFKSNRKPAPEPPPAPAPEFPAPPADAPPVPAPSNTAPPLSGATQPARAATPPQAPPERPAPVLVAPEPTVVVVEIETPPAEPASADATDADREARRALRGEQRARRQEQRGANRQLRAARRTQPAVRKAHGALLDDIRKALAIPPGWVGSPPIDAIATLPGDRAVLRPLQVRASAAPAMDPAVGGRLRADFGNALSHAGFQDAAAAELIEALRMDESIVPAWTTLGGMLRKKGALGLSREALDVALEFDPRDGFAHFGLALLHEAQGKIGKADAEYLLALDLQPELWLPSFNPLVIGNERAEIALHRYYLQQNEGGGVLVQPIDALPVSAVTPEQ